MLIMTVLAAWGVNTASLSHAATLTTAAIANLAEADELRSHPVQEGAPQEEVSATCSMLERAATLLASVKDQIVLDDTLLPAKVMFMSAGAPVISSIVSVVGGSVVFFVRQLTGEIGLGILGL